MVMMKSNKVIKEWANSGGGALMKIYIHPPGNYMYGERQETKQGLERGCEITGLLESFELPHQAYCVDEKTGT